MELARRRSLIWYRENMEKAKERGKIKYLINPEYYKRRSKLYASKNPERKKESDRKWRKSNPEKYRENKKRWNQLNPEKISIYMKKAHDKTRSTPKGKLNHSISSAITISLSGEKRGRHWETLIGYSLDILMKHLEKKFKSGMTWENYGKNGWHVDHIIPKSAFNFEKPEDDDFKKCWSLKNLRPLWAKENLIKHDKIEKPFQPSLVFNVNRGTNCGQM